jgi:anti-sigma factor RsiW
MNAPMDDKQLREYLLGGLTPEERGQIEHRTFEDDDFADFLRESEADLLDGFTSGTLNEEDRRRFAALASNSAWAAKLEVSRWIATQSARAPFGRATRTTPWWLGWAAALAAATLAGWMARENRRLSAPPDNPAASLVASISMAAGTQRDSSDRTFVIPASSEVLRVEMPAESGYEDYVLSVEGSGASFSVPALLRAETVVGWIPSAMLPSGHYDFLLKARRSGASELLATYPVRIERN